MKKSHFISIMLILAAVVGCTFTNREIEVNAAKFINEPSFVLSKKALGYAMENKSDSLLHLFRKDVAKNINSEQISSITKEVQSVVSESTLPSDSIIQVSRTKIKSITGEKMNYTYTFPFKNIENNSVKHIEIGIENNEVVSFFITQKEIKVL